MRRKPPCKCGHLRSEHKYIYYRYGSNKSLISKRSLCQRCGRRTEVLPHGGVYSEPKCFSYTAMDNLDFIEYLAEKKGLV